MRGTIGEMLFYIAEFNFKQAMLFNPRVIVYISNIVLLYSLAILFGSPIELLVFIVIMSLNLMYVFSFKKYILEKYFVFFYLRQNFFL